jgi:hypothetical protein
MGAEANLPPVDILGSCGTVARKEADLSRLLLMAQKKNVRRAVKLGSAAPTRTGLNFNQLVGSLEGWWTGISVSCERHARHRKHRSMSET